MRFNSGRLRTSSAVLVLILSSLAGIRAVTPDALSWVRTVGSAQGVQFIYPYGLAIGGPAGQIYVADVEFQSYVSDRVQVFNENGTPAFTFGGKGIASTTDPQNGKLWYPTGLAVDAAG